MKRLTKEDFIIRSLIIHGEKYDYSLVNYVNNSTKIDIICIIHGVFQQRPVDHLEGSGCEKCSYELRGFNKRKKLEEFLTEAFKVHGNKYDSSEVVYKNAHTKIVIICFKHGRFLQEPNNHLNGQNCPECAKTLNGIEQRKSLECFIEQAKNIHGNKYDYSKVEYINSNIPVDIICKKHEVFKQRPSKHLSGQGCLICRESIGEKKVARFLDFKSILYIRNHTFENCRDKNLLVFDFYLPDYNFCIEYDGRQHFEIVAAFGGIDGLKDRIKKDNIKNNYCKENNIEMIRISYLHLKNIESILNNIFVEKKCQKRKKK